MRELLLDRWPLPEGSFFLEHRVGAGQAPADRRLQQRGFVRARIVASRAEVDPALTAAALTLRIDSGPRLAFGPTTIRGLQRYDRFDRRGAAAWASESGERADGDPYSFDDLLTFQERLRASGYFNSVDVLPDLDAVEADPARTGCRCWSK